MSRKAVSVEPQAERLFLVFVNEDESLDEYVEAELEGLAEAANGEVVGSARQRIDRPHHATYIGAGKVEEIAAYAADTGADCVVVDAELSGVQLRNLEEGLQRRVIDRTQLILDIFGLRARTHEGKLQVELAQYTYRLPRLMSVYTKFERQQGGIGTRGPGETKLESDKQVVRKRIAKLNADIERVREQRKRERAGRLRHALPVAAIVGYTSSGKSTLMNRLSDADLLADAMPFATLDPTTRRLELPDGFALFLTDTVGFIRNLPTHLVAAFRATLEEVSSADLLVHVIDASNPDWRLQHETVLETIEQIGGADVPVLTAFNKADLVEDRSELTRLVAEWPDSVAISALTGEGLDELLRKLRETARKRLSRVRAMLPYDQSGLLEACYRSGVVNEEEYREGGLFIDVEVPAELAGRLEPYACDPA